ncbi:fumarylacetoacetate hydrolase family protein [Ramlibacter tataouinensis]|uniref:fumarylacetoacetate hydrolase family protein n=1 Tax=Ramlibacter tataouinensis TaxID=94132 RepID=UPI0022F3A1A3|nr:fumarylacetoacetate hydrolase family protein [Ramlibacter tataouinensis]WBX99913.1 fumarylacetoacetate hydrolase family protein [Ramlibacter tataouinensis]
MKLATYRDGSRDGQLVLVSRDLDRATLVTDMAHTLQDALDRWDDLEPLLRQRWRQLEAGKIAGAFPFQPRMCMAPLPRAYQWVDGSAYLNHVALVRRARGAAMPPELLHDPLMYQGGSDSMVGACDDIACGNEEWGIDFEAEVAVITGDVPAGISAQEALAAVKLVMVVNDVSLRNLIPSELAKGFGFLQSKPSSSFSPVAVTPDELGVAWDGGRLHMQMATFRNAAQVGRLDCGDGMHFSFGQLIAHLCRTRPAGAGTIVGGGTVSNESAANGYGCIAEQRTRETLEGGAPKTPYLRHGETVRIEVRDKDGRNVFGTIDQKVVAMPIRACS